MFERRWGELCRIGGRLGGGFLTLRRRGGRSGVFFGGFFGGGVWKILKILWRSLISVLTTVTEGGGLRKGQRRWRLRERGRRQRLCRGCRGRKGEALFLGFVDCKELRWRLKTSSA